MSFRRMWEDLAPVGLDRRTGGYRRFTWTPEDVALREWFVGEAQRRSLDVVADRSGNVWAWTADPDSRPGLVLGSHLDSVPDGGAYDGPLGLVSAFAAIDLLKERGTPIAGPLGIVCFAEEEGARFGVACTGSRLLTGALDPDRARRLTDDCGTTFAEAAAARGFDVRNLGSDPEALRRVGTFVELHIEQGRGLVHQDAPMGVASSIHPHGRWRFELTGRADHAGTTRLVDRVDPMLRLATAISTARTSAERHGTLATIGKVAVRPGAVNAIPSGVTAWLDVRGESPEHVLGVVAEVASAAAADAVEESWTAASPFAASLRSRLAALLAAPDGSAAPILTTGAGHDAGVLAAAGIDTAMLFVRNPTGVSHSPHEHADAADCSAGVEALATVVAALA